MPSEEAQPPDDESLDDVLARLEGAIERLTDQHAPLDRLVADYELARDLTARARRRWEDAEQRVRRLQPQLQPKRGAT
jgi:exodeoxyribonuclease VII small subunit